MHPANPGTDLQILGAIVTLLQSMGTWPVMSLLAFMVVAPWAILVYLMVVHNRHRQEDKTRFEAVVSMYESNVELVDDFKDLAGGYRELITWTVGVVTEAKEIAEKNQFCPWVRKNSNPKDIETQ